MKAALALAAAAISLPTAAVATPYSLNIVIDGFDDDSARCGVSKESVRAALLAAMRYNRIIESGSSLEGETSAILYLAENTVRSESKGFCSTAINMEVISPAKYSYLEGYDNAVSTFTQFCAKSRLISGWPQISNLSNHVKEMFDECLAKID
jgi:hypothetical protein